jgi:hypothetical protein
MTPQLLGQIKKPTGIDISHLVIEDDLPVDNLQSAQQQRLFVEPLYSSKALPVPFLADANVGLFYELKEDPIVPDMLLSLGVQRAEDFAFKEARSYFVWEFGKLPELCIEIVSNKEGDEINLSRKSQRKGKTVSKKDRYDQIGIRHYIVFDPLKQIQADMNQAQVQIWSRSKDDEPLQLEHSLQEVGEFAWFPDLEIGLTLWRGNFEEEVTRVWLRWCDRDGTVIPTGAERANQAEFRAEMAEFQAENERSRAEDERSRAEDAELRANNAELAAQRLADRLRALGLNPDEL